VSKLPKSVKMTCSKHGDTMRFHQESGDYYCIDEFDGSYCASIHITVKEKRVD